MTLEALPHSEPALTVIPLSAADDRVQPPTDLQFTVIPLDSGTAPGYFKARTPVAKPCRIYMRRRGGTWILRRAWMHADLWGLVLFAIPWNCFLALWNTQAIVARIWFLMVFALPHDALGIYLMYTVVVSLSNSTYFTIKNGKLTVKNRPIGRGETFSCATCTMMEILCKRHIKRGKKNTTTTTYSVLYRDASNAEHEIVAELPTAHQALFISQELEKKLGFSCPDVAVETFGEP